MAWGQIGNVAVPANFQSGYAGYHNEGETKSMRKLMAGDSIWFVAQDAQDVNNSVQYTIQFFYKT